MSFRQIQTQASYRKYHHAANCVEWFNGLQLMHVKQGKLRFSFAFIKVYRCWLFSWLNSLIFHRFIIGDLDTYSRSRLRYHIAIHMVKTSNRLTLNLKRQLKFEYNVRSISRKSENISLKHEAEINLEKYTRINGSMINVRCFETNWSILNYHTAFPLWYDY